jgi:hypothetical protein
VRGDPSRRGKRGRSRTTIDILCHAALKANVISFFTDIDLICKRRSNLMIGQGIVPRWDSVIARSIPIQT